jgi:hypothetical protein
MTTASCGRHPASRMQSIGDQAQRGPGPAQAALGVVVRLFKGRDFLRAGLSGTVVQRLLGGVTFVDRTTSPVVPRGRPRRRSEAEPVTLGAEGPRLG